MKQNNFNRVGSEEQYGPRTIEEIVKDFLAHSRSPFAVAYRKQKARQKATRTEGLKPNTELSVDLKTLLRSDSIMRAGKVYVGTMTREVICEEYHFDDSHFTFTEIEPLSTRRNPRVFSGRYINVTRRQDGTLRPNFKPIRIGDGFDVVSYATAVGNELLWALEGLVEKSYTKVPSV